MPYQIKTDRLNNLNRDAVLSDDDPRGIILYRQDEAIKVIKNEYGEYVPDFKRSKSVGFKTREIITKINNHASDRIRAKWVVEQEKDFEIWREHTNYDIIIFYSVDNDELDRYSGIKIFNICDPIWADDKDVLPFVDQMDYIIVPTVELKKELEHFTEVPIKVIGDGHNLDKRVSRIHKGVAKNVIWYGYSDNAYILDKHKRFLKNKKLELTCVSDKKIECDRFIKWTLGGCDKEIQKADIAFLPIPNKYKSDNKTINAILNGTPVAHDRKDIMRLIDAKERNKDIKKDLSKYDIKKIAKQYKKLCAELLATKKGATIQE